MQRISHLIFDGAEIIISGHPWPPASASSAWSPGPSPWPAWPSWSPGWRRRPGAGRTSASSPDCDIRTGMLTLYSRSFIWDVYLYGIGFWPREERKEILDCRPHGVVCVLDSVWVGEALENALEVNSVRVMKFSLRMLLSSQSTDCGDCRQLTALQLGRLSSCVLASPDTLTLTTADPAQHPGEDET